MQHPSTLDKLCLRLGVQNMIYGVFLDYFFGGHIIFYYFFMFLLVVVSDGGAFSSPESWTGGSPRAALASPRISHIDDASYARNDCSTAIQRKLFDFQHFLGRQ